MFVAEWFESKLRSSTIDLDPEVHEHAQLYALHVIHADVDLYGPHETSEFTRNMRNEGEKYLNKVKVKCKSK